MVRRLTMTKSGSAPTFYGRTKLLARLTVFMSATLAIGVQAVEVDAGLLQQQMERSQPLKLPLMISPKSDKLPIAESSKTGPLVTLKQFRFTGNSKLSSQMLSTVVSQYLGKSLSFSQLEAVLIDVSEAYREAGWVVRVFLPEQDIVNGIVDVQIIEATFGEVIVKEKLPGVATSEVLKKIINAQQESSQLLSSQAIDRALLIAGDISGALVTGSLQEGQVEGQTDLLLKLLGKPLLQGGITTDNTGAVSTGASRILVNLGVNNFLAAGDTLSTQLMSTTGTKYIRIGNSMPIGVYGLRVGVNASKLNYNVLQLAAELDAKGSSDTLGLEASYPLIRSRLQNLSVNFSVDGKNFKNLSAGEVSSEYKNKIISLGLSGNSFDSLGGGGANSANLTLFQGKLNLDGSPNAEEVAFTTQTNGLYRKLRYTLIRQQEVTNQLSLYAALSGQLANKNLDSSEKFYLGGSSGVRAYPSSEGGGASGTALNLELRWQVASGYSWVGFFDAGHVTVNRSNNFSSAPAVNDFVIKGAGVAINWQVKNGLELKAIWARRIGNNPNADLITGSDQDGSLVKNRFWASANLLF